MSQQGVPGVSDLKRWDDIMSGSWDTISEIIDSGPMSITDLFQNKYLAYFRKILAMKT